MNEFKRRPTIGDLAEDVVGRIRRSATRRVTIPLIENGRNLGAVSAALNLPENTTLFQERNVCPLFGPDNKPVVLADRGMRELRIGVVYNGKFYDQRNFDTPSGQLTNADRRRRAEEGITRDVLSNMQQRGVLPQQGELDMVFASVPVGATDETGYPLVANVTVVVVKKR